jgi:lipopolysaccharide cholinephosphotransferase
MLNYENWLFESNIRTTGWKDEDHEVFEKMKLDNLRKTCALCDKHKVRYFLDAGTLLGLYRDKKIIRGDSDNDISIFAEDITPEFLKELGAFCKAPEADANFFQPNEMPDFEDEETFLNPLSLKYHTLSTNGRRKSYKGKLVWTDMFVLYPHKNYRLFMLGPKYFRIPEKFTKKLGQLTHEGTTFRIPNPVEGYLEHVFGEGWATPDPHYVSSKENRGFYVVDKKEHGVYKYNWATKTGKIDNPD